ncbi:MAG TPA: hypothetical protein PLJ38_11960 [bacterium]|nr:hypothetical protein [bacterium]
MQAATSGLVAVPQPSLSIILPAGESIISKCPPVRYSVGSAASAKSL